MKQTIMILLFLFALAGGAAEAHQPRIVGSSTAVEVDSPEISRAYYGELPGETVVYIIRASAPFKLYVGLLVPDVPGIETGISAQIFKDLQPFANLDGVNFEWKRMHEEYAGDDYLKGPEYSANVEAGLYEIYVNDADNRGKYVVAIGEKEEWPFSEMWTTLKILPGLKKDFFEKSPWTLINSRIGFYLLSIVVIVAAVVIVVCLIARRARGRSARRAASGGPGR